MTQEEKAKAYDEAVKKLRVLRDDWAKTQNRAAKEVEEIFPELKESEDERIRKSITEFFKNYSENGTWKAIPDVTKWIAWLEAQGKNNMGISEATKKKLEDNLNKALEKETPESWNEFLDEKKPADKVEQKGMNIVEEDMTPFQKKVFCIIDTTIEEEQGLKQVCDELLRLAHDEIKQKSAWSEKDEIFVHGLIRGLVAKRDIHGHTTFSSDCIDITETINWLKSLKDRVQPKPKPAWSEEDEKRLGLAIYMIEQAKVDAPGEFEDYRGLNQKDYQEVADWLKSLRPQNHCRPSDEQMSVLNEVINFAAKSAYAHWSDFIYSMLNSLREQLKKLKG